MQPPSPALRGIVWASPARTNTAWTSQNHTTGSTAHTWGVPTQLVASTGRDTHWVYLRCNTVTSVSNGACGTLVQLYGGANGSEYVIAGPIEWGGRPAGTGAWLPLFIPAGTRLSVAVKSVRASTAFTFGIDVYATQGGGEGWPTRWVGYGLVDDASNSRGTLVTAGSSDAWGSWTALTTSTTYPHSLWIPMAGRGSAAAGGAVVNVTSQFVVDDTTDAATMATNGTVRDGTMWADSATEQLTDYAYGAFGIAPGFWPMYAPAAAGASVSARSKCSGAVVSNATSLSILGAVM